MTPNRMRTHFIAAVALLLCAGMLLSPAGPARAAATWPQLNRALVEQHIVPRYERLAHAAALLEERTAAFCAVPDAAGLDGVRDAYQQTMDAWAAVQHVRFGPITVQQRYERFQYWPDKHSTGERQLNQALAAADTAQLADDRFPSISIALQGLGTLERVLYDDDAEIGRFGSAGQPAYPCLLGKAIAHNLAVMSRETFTEWTAGDTAYRQVIAGAEQGNATFVSSEEVAARLLNDLYTSLQVVVDQKLLPAMGRSFAEISPRRVESWRSGRSLRNIELNLEADEALYASAFSPPLVADGGNAARVEEDAAIRRGFRTALGLVRGLRQPLDQAIQDEKQRPMLEQLLATVSDLKRHISGPIPVALGLPRSFNGLDGD